jgi:hypothetical protein
LYSVSLRCRHECSMTMMDHKGANVVAIYNAIFSSN